MKNKFVTCALLCGGVLAMGVTAGVNPNHSSIVSAEDGVTTSYTFDSSKLTLASCTAGEINLLPVGVSLNNWAINGKWTVRLKATNATALTRNGETTSVGNGNSVGIAIIGGKLLFETGNGWGGVSLFITPEENDVITFNGTFTGSSEGVTYSITLQNISVKFDGTTWVGTGETASKTYDASNIVSVGGYSNSSNTVVTFNINETDIASPNSDWNAHYFCEDAITIKRADGTTLTQKATLIKQSATTYALIYGSWEWGVQYQANDGDILTLNGTFTLPAGMGSINLTINGWTAVYGGGSWSIIKNSYTFDDENFSVLPTQMTAINNNGESVHAIYFTRNEDDNTVKVSSEWAHRYANSNPTVTVTHEDGTKDTFKTTFFANFTNYCFSFETWGTGLSYNYNFRNGDEIVINGTFLGIGSHETQGNSITFNNVHIGVKNNKFYKDPTVIVATLNTNLAKLESEVSYSEEYVNLVKKSVNLYNQLSFEDKATLDQTTIDTLFDQDALIKGHAFEEAGRNVHYSTIQTSAVSATTHHSEYPDGLIFAMNEIDFCFRNDKTLLGEVNGQKYYTGYESKAWDSFWRSTKGIDSYVLTPNGEKTSIVSTVILYQGSSDGTVIPGDYRGGFIFETWAGNAYNFQPGDKFVIGRTTYVADFRTKSYYVDINDLSKTEFVGDDVYVVTFEGAEFTWTGKYWVDSVTVPNLPSLVKAINDIGEVEYTQECKAKIDTANNLYNSLIEAESKWVSKEVIDSLDEKIEAYKLAKAVYEAGEVEVIINNIGTVTLDTASEERIAAAREAYDALDASAKLQVSTTTLAVLTNAEATYKRLQDEKLMNDVVALIDAIGTVDGSNECKERVETAREAYDAFEALNTGVEIPADKIKVLTDAEAAIKSNEALDEFKSALTELDAIENKTTDSFYAKLIKVIKLYNALSESAKNEATSEYATLEANINAYNASIAGINEVQSNASNAAVATISVVASAALLGAALSLLKKKGMF